MKALHNIEMIRRLAQAPELLHLGGWALQADGRPWAGIRLRAEGTTALGYYGIRRTDVAGALGFGETAGYAGFSFLVRLPPDIPACTLEVATSEGAWQTLCSVDLRQMAAPVPAAVTPPEAAGWEAAPPTLSPQPVLFIGHDFAAAGAQLLMLRLVRWLRAQAVFPIETLLAVPRSSTIHATPPEREILAGLTDVGPVHFLSDLTQAPENLAAIRAGNYRLIHANTATLGWLLPSLLPLPCPVVSHVHELGFWLEKRTGLGVLARQVAVTEHFIACSTPVRDCLVRLAGVPADSISVIHDCGSLARATGTRQRHTRESVRRELGLPADAFVVAACGTFDWRKGAELFAPICVATRRRLPGVDFHALWIGPYGTELVRAQFEHEIAAAGLQGRVRLLGQRAEPLKWMLAADCFALPSREDPFPIVMLEAGTLGLPIVGFQKSGGVTEFVGDEAGLLAPYLDIEAFAAALATLAKDPASARSQGAAAARRAAEFDEETSFARIRELLLSRSRRTL